MTFNPETRLFYFSYSYLWNVFASIEILSEIQGSEESTWILSSFDSVHEQIAGWLLQEQLDFIEKESGLSNTLEELYVESRENITSALRRWSDILLYESSRAHGIVSSISRANWAYYLYCSWLEETLNVFSALIQQYSVYSEGFYRRYISKAPVFNELIRAIQEERRSITILISDNRPHDIAKELDKAASQMAREWREAVIAVSYS